MSDIKETVFLGFDNPIRLLLKEDDKLLSEAYPSMTPTRWVLLVHFDTPQTIDSAVDAEAFSWDGPTSTLQLLLGPLFAEEQGYTATTLIIYADEFPNGLVLLHPTHTQDKLKLRFTDEA